MSKRLRLADIDRLIGVLDSARRGPRPQAEIDTLYHAYASARSFEMRARILYGCAIVGLVIAYLAYAFANSALLLPDWLYPIWLVLLVLHLVALGIFARLFPVLRRREQVATLLEFFETDLSQVDKLRARGNPPQNVLNAIEVLERARSLGPSYSIVERWTGRAEGWDFDRLYLVFFWLTAIVVAHWGDKLGLSEFLRGALGGIVALLALQYFLRTRDERDLLRRAEDALGRWRHLVPKMRELPE